MTGRFLPLNSTPCCANPSEPGTSHLPRRDPMNQPSKTFNGRRSTRSQDIDNTVTCPKSNTSDKEGNPQGADSVARWISRSGGHRRNPGPINPLRTVNEAGMKWANRYRK